MREEIWACKETILGIKKEPVHGCVFINIIKGVFRLKSSEVDSHIMIPRSMSRKILELVENRLKELEEEFNNY